VGGAFFVATAGMAAAVFVGAVAIFTLVPRVGAGFSVGVTRMSGSAAGFADEIAIGRYGTRPAHRHDVVLRATLTDLTLLPAGDDARTRAADELYFRGAAYDGYAGGRWVHTHRPELRTIVEAQGRGNDGRFAIGEDRGALAPRAGTVRQEIEAIGIPASVLVALDRPRAFELPATKLGCGRHTAGVSALVGRGGAAGRRREGDTFITLSHAHYVAYSTPPGAEAGGAPSLAPGARAAYLSVPDDLRRRLGNLAATFGDPDLDGGETIAAITRALRETHGYTLEPLPSPAGVDPVESFLLGEHAGHCELFASAAVLLLRLRGVPARYVTGFRGGEWNAVGGYVAVRDDRAHAWAEAFIADRGWVRVDATPPGAAVAARRARVRGDGRARLLLEPLGRRPTTWAASSSWRGAPGDTWPRRRRARRARGWRWSVGAACLLLALLLAARRLRWPRARAADSEHEMLRRPIWTAPRLGAIERLYRRTLGRLARAGCPAPAQRDAPTNTRTGCKLRGWSRRTTSAG
jgi:hypothetical protein